MVYLDDDMSTRVKAITTEKLPSGFKSAEQRVRDFWALGKESLRRHRSFPKGPNTIKQDEAKHFRVGAEKLRQARQFALQCDKTELDQRMHQARELAVAPDWLVLREISTLKSPSVRERTWTTALRGGMNHRQILTYIRGERLKRSGQPTPGAGRKPKVDADPDLAYAKLLQVSRQWLSVAYIVNNYDINAAKKKRIAIATKQLELLFR